MLPQLYRFSGRPHAVAERQRSAWVMWPAAVSNAQPCWVGSLGSQVTPTTTVPGARHCAQGGATGFADNAAKTRVSITQIRIRIVAP